MGPEGELRRTHRGRAQMTRTGRTALKFALDVRKSGTIGTDILVRRRGSPDWRRCGKPVLSRSPMPASRSRAILSIRAANECHPEVKPRQILRQSRHRRDHRRWNRYRQPSLSPGGEQNARQAFPRSGADWHPDRSGLGRRALGRSWKASDIDGLLARHPHMRSRLSRAGSYQSSLRVAPAASCRGNPWNPHAGSRGRL